VASILRITGRDRERRFVNYHRVLNRAAWSGRTAAQVLLGLLLDTFAPKGPVLLGLDDTIERRRGKRIGAKGIYRDPVRSSHGHFVKASGLRWLGLMLLVPISWAERVWALPFLTALAPSERYCRERGLRHKKLTDWGRQLVLQARRWMPDRQLVVVTDGGFSALEFLAALLRQEVACVTRLRLDAALYQPAPPRRPGTLGRPRTKGERLPTLAEVLADKTTRWQRLTVPGWYGEGDRIVEICSGTAVWRHAGLPVVPIRWVLLRDPCRRFDPQALLCTDPAQEPPQIVRWFVQRWQLEVTFREVRDHLGVETQRQWSDKAIARTTPCLLGLFSVVTLLASRLDGRARAQASASAWYRKRRPTFADTLAAVRRATWSGQGFVVSRQSAEATKLPPPLREGIAYALCHAA
jgi:DDE superfamily endonuclease